MRAPRHLLQQLRSHRGQLHPHLRGFPYHVRQPIQLLYVGVPHIIVGGGARGGKFYSNDRRVGNIWSGLYPCHVLYLYSSGQDTPAISTETVAENPPKKQNKKGHDRCKQPPQCQCVGLYMVNLIPLHGACSYRFGLHNTIILDCLIVFHKDTGGVPQDIYKSSAKRYELCARIMRGTGKNGKRTRTRPGFRF